MMRKISYICGLLLFSLLLFLFFGQGSLFAVSASEPAASTETTEEEESDLISSEGLADQKAEDGNWYYYTNGEVDTTFTGLAENKNGRFYVKNGAVDFTYSGLYLLDGTWYTIHSGAVDLTITGLVYNPGTYGVKGWFYVEEGVVDFGFTSLVKHTDGNWYYVKNGMVRFSTTGLVKNDGTYGTAGWYYVKSGVVKFGFTSLVKHTDENWYYVKNGMVRFSVTGLVKNDGTYGTAGWYYVKNGVVTFGASGLCRNSSGCWYVKNGRVDFSYSGSYTYGKYTYVIKNGKVISGLTAAVTNVITAGTASDISCSWLENLEIAQSTSQVILVSVSSGSYAVLSMYEKTNEEWEELLSVSARIGKNGLGKTKEGDGKTPVGVYYFTQAFGIAANPGTALSYTKVNSSHYWVDDSDSVYYNQLVSTSLVTKDWSSAEHLIEYTQAYQYAIALNYNSACTPGLGSAIFLHCSTGSSTLGCIAIAKSAVLTVLKNVTEDCVLIIDYSINMENY